MAVATSWATAASSKAVTGPGLAETLEFIRGKVSQQGKINYAGTTHDAADSSDWVNQFSVEATNVTADPATCAVKFHWTTAVDGKEAQDFDTSLEFANLESVVLTSMEQDVNRTSAKAGHPTWTTRVNPSIWVVTSTLPDGTNYVVDFQESDLAERVVKAMTHAINLCGGNKREAF